ncbi:MAG: hypothetical protein Aureis2KO_01480 [Aureisphaera sp.]
MDALADAVGQVHNTPYGYALNNPIALNDPDGNCPPGVDCFSFAKGFIVAAKDAVVEAIKTLSAKGNPGAYTQMGAEMMPVINSVREDPEGTGQMIVDEAKKSISTPEGLGYGVGSVVFALAEPSPRGEMNALNKTVKQLGNLDFDVNVKADFVAAPDGNISTSSPDFVVTSDGTTVPIPDGAVGPGPPNKGSGMVYQSGSGGKGMDSRTTGVRIMDPNANQGRRVNYMNNNRTTAQTVDPMTGKTISNKDPRGHLPLPVDPQF